MAPRPGGVHSVLAMRPVPPPTAHCGRPAASAHQHDGPHDSQCVDPAPAGADPSTPIASYILTGPTRPTLPSFRLVHLIRRFSRCNALGTIGSVWGSRRGRTVS